MRLVQRAGIEAVLPEVPGPVPPRIEIEGVAAMSPAQGDAEGLRLLGNRDQVNVVAHQTIGQDAHLGLRAVFGQAVQVGVPIGVGKEDSLAVDTSLGDVVRRSYCHRFVTRDQSSPSPPGEGEGSLLLNFEIRGSHK